MNKKMLEYIGDMNDFLGNNWEAFQEYMALLGFTEEQVDELSEELTEFLFNTD